MKVTAIAPANIALIKYWGMRDAALTLPANASISMMLSRCVARTTLEAIDGKRDEAWLAADDTLRGQTKRSPAKCARNSIAFAHMHAPVRRSGASGRSR